MSSKDNYFMENKILAQRIKAIEDEVHNKTRDSLHKLREIAQVLKIEVENIKEANMINRITILEQWQKDFINMFDRFSTDITKKIEVISNRQVRILIGIGIVLALINIFF